MMVLMPSGYNDGWYHDGTGAIPVLAGFNANGATLVGY